MASTAALLIWNVAPGASPGRAHPLLGSAPLALTAIALLIYQFARRPARLDLARRLIPTLSAHRR